MERTGPGGCAAGPRDERWPEMMSAGPRSGREHRLGAEREDGRRVERLARAEDRAGEVRLVRRVREVLGLERVAGALAVGLAADAHQRAVEEVAAVELNARLVGPD